MNKKGKLYLIPTPLGTGLIKKSLTSEDIYIIQSLSDFIVENEKVARKFLREIEIKVPQKSLRIEEFGKYSRKPINEYFSPLENGLNMGLLSDAGCPGIADPGSEIILEAHKRTIQVIPLVGPSSIILGLMASGFNGQSFTFHGYLPIEKKARRDKLRLLENQAEKLNQTQIFIETPYRNTPMIEEITESLKPNTLISIAANLTTPHELIITQKVSDLKLHPPQLDKIPAIFLIYKSFQ